MVAVAGAFAQTSPTPAPKTFTSGIVGIAFGETVRFNVLNPGIVPASTTTTTAVACAAVLTYYDGSGALLKTSTVSVAPGTAGYLDLFSDVDLSLPANQRKQIRATFTMLPVPPPTASSTGTSVVAPVCRLIGNLEIFDSITGRTQVVVGAMHRVKAEAAEPTPTPTPAAGQ